MPKSIPSKNKTALDPLFIHKLLKENFQKPVDPTASFFLEGVLQYLGSEILERCYQSASRSGGRIRITADDVLKVIHEDADLSYLIRLRPKEEAQTPNVRPEGDEQVPNIGPKEEVQTPEIKPEEDQIYDIEKKEDDPTPMEVDSDSAAEK